MILTIIAILLFGLAVGFTVYPRYYAPLCAYAGLLALHMSYSIYVSTPYLWFWAVSAVIAATIYRLVPEGEPDGRRVSNVYITLGAIAGAMLGILVEPRLMVLGTIVGTALGVMAYSSTPAGVWLRTSWRTLAQYYAAKGLPAVVTISIIGVAVMGVIS